MRTEIFIICLAVLVLGIGLLMADDGFAQSLIVESSLKKPKPGASVPLLGAGIGGGLSLVGAAAFALVRRRRRRGKNG